MPRFKNPCIQLEADTQNNKKLFTGIILRGSITKQTKEFLQNKIKPTKTIGMESMQIENEARRAAMLSLFVVKPAQTGFSAMAELTASAIKNPSGTAVLALRGESGDRDVEINLDKLINNLNENGSFATDNKDALADYIEQAKDLSGEYVFLDDSTTDDTDTNIDNAEGDDGSTNVVVQS